MKLIFPFADKASINNARLSAIVMHYLGFDILKINQKIKEFIPVSMLLEIMRGSDNNLIINDSYIADLQSLEIALSTLKEQSGKKHKLLIISDFEVDEKEKKSTYKSVQKLIEAFEIDQILHIGNELNAYLDEKKSLNFRPKMH